jgi:NAD(P)-dependent dehydrogenase (short-subunit alcohol dehydrogenase family)
VSRRAAEESVPGSSLDWGLADKTVVVTGASSGIGAATARALGDAGAAVVLVGRDEKRLQDEVAEVESRGGRPHPVYADIEEPGAAAGVIEQAVEACGPLHGIVHSASLFDPRPLAETTIESAERQWRTNVLAPLVMTQAAVPHLERGASVVFVGSTTGSVGFPGCSAYAATKGAVNALTRALAVELAPNGVRVNIVVPGYVRTPMLQPHLDANASYEDWIVERTPVGRIGGPEELAPSIVYLLSPLSRYVDGATLVADGGWIAQ